MLAKKSQQEEALAQLQMQHGMIENEIRTQEADLRANANRFEDLKSQVGKLEQQIGRHLNYQSGQKISADSLKTKVEQLETQKSRIDEKRQ